MTTFALSRRAAMAGLAAAGVFSPAILRAQGSNWPKAGTLRMVIPFPPAGATDVIGRIVADKLGQIWGNQVVIENKGGAGGNIGTDQVAKSTPDGNTM
ncbi:MAG: Bug family tripartite tricarboxylate transporter substrate binding protein, partial [Rhabdaerophilum sp.]